MDTTPPRWLRTASAPGLAFGADYNPEQWPRATWDEDVAAMRAAGVTIVSVGIFAWARLQPTADTWAFEWLDDVMDLLHANGIAVDLATATASPPPWLTTAHPEILPVTARGETVWPGGRQHWRPTSPVFRRYALTLVAAIANRYAGHPALAAWHCPTSWAATTSTTTPTTPPGPSATGCGGAIAASTGSTPRGAPPSGPSATGLGGDPAAPAGRDLPQPDAAARLQALLLRRAPEYLRAERDCCARSLPTSRSRPTSW